jgi:hypothetical protein
LVDKSFDVASCDLRTASVDEPERLGRDGLADATGGRVDDGNAIPKSGVEVSFASFVELKSGNDGSGFGELGKASMADGTGVVTAAGVGVEVNNPGLCDEEVPKIGVVGKVAVPTEESSGVNGLFALGLADAGAGVEANPVLGAVLNAAHGSVVVAVDVNELLLVAVNGPVTPDISGVVVSRSTRFSSSGLSVVFVPLSATKPP